MADLLGMLTELGAAEVQTYVQSGNAVFDSPAPEAEISRQIEELLSAYMGRPIGITLRTKKELSQIVENSPLASLATNPTYHCVTFLTHKPTASELAPLRERVFDPECFEVVGREIYTWHPNGQGRSPLAQALAKLKLRGTATTRNFRTVAKLSEMLSARS
jgi:uncharacterized protein (DUF1697 family)